MTEGRTDGNNKETKRANMKLKRNTNQASRANARAAGQSKLVPKSSNEIRDKFTFTKNQPLMLHAMHRRADPRAASKPPSSQLVL